MNLLVFAALLVAVTPQVKADENCDICMLVTGYIASELKLSNSTKAEVKKDAEQMCLQLITSISDECTSIVNHNFSDIVQLLHVDHLKPKEVCEQLGLCSATKSSKLDRKTHLKADIPCPVCKVIMMQVDEFLVDSPTEDNIDSVLRNLCLQFEEGELRLRCNDYLNRFGNKIFSLLYERMDPDDICIELGLCEAKQQLDKKTQLKDQQFMTHDLQHLQYPVKTTELKADPVACTVCELGMKTANNYMLENVPKHAMIKILEDDCDSLENPLATECHDLLNQYGVDVIKMITERLDPRDVCIHIGECDAKQVKVTVRDGEICQVCKLVGQYLLTVLQSNATEQEIEQALEQVCGVLPQSLSQECDSLVEQYGAETFSLLQKLTPDELCKDIGLCRGKALVGDNKCMLGPTFWCASPDNAQMCNAVQHCKNHVW